jgi:hypothetical protein
MSTPDAFSCGACSWFQATLIHNTTGLAATGYCRRHAPAHNGFPAVFVDGWCGDFTPGSEGTGEGAPEGAEVAVDAASDAATETTEAELRARIQELTKETEMLVKGMDVFGDHCAKLIGDNTQHLARNTQHLARIAQLEAEAKVMRDAMGESREVERQAVDSRDRRIAQLEEALRDMAELGREMAGKARVDDTTSVANHLLINHLLESCGLTLPDQEPTE